MKATAGIRATGTQPLRRSVLTFGVALLVGVAIDHPDEFVVLTFSQQMQTS